MQTTTLARQLGIFAAALFVAACSSEASPPVSGSGGAGGDASSSVAASSTSSSSSAAGSGGSTCVPPGYAGPPSPLLVDTVEASIVDIGGNPVPGLLSLVCGLDICIFGQSGADGHVLLNLAGQKVDHPAFKYGDGLTYARLATPITAATSVFPLAVTARLPDIGPPLLAGQVVSSGGVTLSIPPGAEITIDVLTYDTPPAQQFRAAAIPIDKAPPAVDPALKLELLFAAAPVDTVFCPPAAVSIPNTAGWPPGASVEFFVHGVSISQEYAPYGGWAKVSDGRVSADGATISTDAAGGLPVLSVFGVRRKPRN